MHFPKINDKKMRRFRAEFDPLKKIIDPHITLLFPIKCSKEITKAKLVRHIEKILVKQKPFQIKLEGLFKTWDHWMFLRVNRGKKEIIRLHDKLYFGNFRKYLREDIPYIPGVGIGFFGAKNADYHLRNPKLVTLDKSRYLFALRKVKDIDLKYSSKFDGCSLIQLDNQFKSSKIVKEFPFSD